MGLFDFLHGKKPAESEAEAYMKERNKEYARKVATYKRREAMENMTANISENVQSSAQTALQNSRNNQNSTMETFGKVFGSAAGTMFKEFGDMIHEIMQTGESCDQQTIVDNRNKVVVTTKTTTSNQYKNRQFQCSDCGTSESIYDGKESALFIVERASARPSTRTLTVNGKIQRGRLKVGDKVTINSSIESNDVVIACINRQDESIEYANSSSGYISLVFNNASFMIRSGDTIVKSKSGFLR